MARAATRRAQEPRSGRPGGPPSKASRRQAPPPYQTLLRARSPWARLVARAALISGMRSLAGAFFLYDILRPRPPGRGRLAIRRLRDWLPAALGRPRAPPQPIWAALSRPDLARRGLGLIYVIAFRSLRAQVLGLYGRRGILPVERHLRWLRQASQEVEPRQGSSLLWLRIAPSLLWLDSSDAGLVRLCNVGQAAGAALAFGVAPRTAAAIAWGAYLSLVTAGPEFLSFQWDMLLLEAGLHAMLGRRRPALMRLLAFRLQFESGLAKLASRDPTWRDLTACRYHQETQPLPTPVGWYAHHLPGWVNELGTGLTLFVECAVPFLTFGPRGLRRAAFALLSGFQGLIALTGNFAFFNWLTVALNLAIVEEPAALPSAAAPPRRSVGRAFADAVEDIAAGTLALLGLWDLDRRVRPRAQRIALLDQLADAVSPLRAVGSYGLFSVMTTKRPEIIVEGSQDGQSWREYGFHYKAGDVTRPPCWVAPHQPRLDWQMWFAALGRPSEWFVNFLVRLLDGSPDVRALLASDPFPGQRPRYVRALLYEYKMADLHTHRQTGAWWIRKRLGVYVPPLTLGSGGRRSVDRFRTL